MFRSLALILLSAPFVVAQQPYYSNNDTVVTTPEQLHRVNPPDNNLSAEELEKRGDELRSEKNYPDAIDFFTLAIEKKPVAGLFNKRGLAKASMMRFDDAKKDFERAVKIDKTLPEAENNLGAMLYYKRNFGGAIKHYKKAIKLQRNASFYSNLGTAFFAKKDYEKAQANYQVALEIDPDVFERQRSRTGTQILAMTHEERAKYDYVIAKMYAARGDSDRCLLYLKKALEEGYPVAKDVAKDQEFAVMRKDPRLKQLIDSKPIVID
jgi:tetratricopeptide (TPR) repeat protein